MAEILAFDPDALRRKYREERDKRLRADGNEQYVEVTDAFAHYVDDPYVEPFDRDPLTDAVDVVIVGGGFGGLLAGARLREAGIEDIRVIEKGGDFGGTWYWNRYPGAMCDVESYIYLPLLEEIGYMPTEKYAHAAEILAHSQAIAKHYDLYANACFQTEVTGMRWDADSARWIISTSRGDAMRARFVCMANGPLHRPKLPGIAGIETFAGHSFHTSRWDYEYTGGDCDGNLTGLHGKRVGIIGKLLVMLRRETDTTLTPEGVAGTLELADFEKMEQIRARVDTIVHDPTAAEALKPYYRQFCKRPCFHDEYLDTFNRPNVTLVDTHGRGVDRITERGVVVDDVEYELDCLIYATGFEVGTDYTRRAGYDLVGRGGMTLSEKWAEGVCTLHGMHSRGFPNCFIMSNMQSGFTVNFPHMLDEQSKHLAYILAYAFEHDVRTVEASATAEDEWVRTIVELAQNNLGFLESCTPGYYNNEGKPAERSGQNGFYGGGSIAFIKLLEQWRADGQLEGLELAT